MDNNGIVFRDPKQVHNMDFFPKQLIGLTPSFRSDTPKLCTSIADATALSDTGEGNIVKTSQKQNSGTLTHTHLPRVRSYLLGLCSSEFTIPYLFPIFHQRGYDFVTPCTLWHPFRLTWMGCCWNAFPSPKFRSGTFPMRDEQLEL